MSIIEKFITIAKRTWMEVLLLSIAWILLWITSPDSVYVAPARLFSFKVILFSSSQVHALLVRKVFWKGAKAKTNMDKAMAIAIHVSSAYLYAQGG